MCLDHWRKKNQHFIYRQEQWERSSQSPSKFSMTQHTGFSDINLTNQKHNSTVAANKNDSLKKFSNIEGSKTLKPANLGDLKEVKEMSIRSSMSPPLKSDFEST